MASAPANGRPCLDGRPPNSSAQDEPSAKWNDGGSYGIVQDYVNRNAAATDIDESRDAETIKEILEMASEKVMEHWIHGRFHARTIHDWADELVKELLEDGRVGRKRSKSLPRMM
jgi:transposase